MSDADIEKDKKMNLSIQEWITRIADAEGLDKEKRATIFRWVEDEACRFAKPQLEPQG
jgi:hypothetical protein